MSPICWLTRGRLDAYQDGELSPAARARTQAHLDRCRGCAAALAGLARLRTALAAPAPEPPEGVWQAFWPQVRARLAAPPPLPEPYWRRMWSGVAGHPRLALGSAVAAAALAVLAVLAPWQGIEQPSRGTIVQAPSVVTPAPTAGEPDQAVVVQSVETGDPQSSVMVFANPESDFTVVWVFGLQRTNI